MEIAGGRDDLALLHRPSRRIEWRKVLEFAPEVVVVTCCGFNLSRCEREGEILATFEGAHDLPAAKMERVYATDGSAYFSRPGPRIVDSVEVLACLIYPDLFSPPLLADAVAAFKLTPAGVVQA